MTFHLYKPDSGKHKNWREMALVTFVKGTMLYAVGTTHTIDGHGERKMPSNADKRRITTIHRRPCINAGQGGNTPTNVG